MFIAGIICMCLVIVLYFALGEKFGKFVISIITSCLLGLVIYFIAGITGIISDPSLSVYVGICAICWICIQLLQRRNV